MKTPNRIHIPVDNIVQQGSDCYYSCCKDSKALCDYGIDWAMVETLPDLVARCAKAQALWVIYLQDRKLVVGELADCVKQGMAVRSKLARQLRNDSYFVKSGYTLKKYSRSRSVLAVIDDLHSLGRSAENFCKSYPRSLIDRTLISDAFGMHETIKKKYTARVCYDDNAGELLDTRNQLVKQIKGTVDELNRAGREVFHGTERAKVYRLAYFKELKLHKKSRKPT